MNIEVPSAHAAFTSNGTTAGIVTVADSSPFYAGCVAWIKSSGQPSARVIIVAIPSATTIKVRFIGETDIDRIPLQIYGGASDISAYTTAQNATISMESQLAHVEPDYVKPAKLFV